MYIRKYGRPDLDVKVLIVVLFMDDTNLDKNSRTSAKPLMATLGNYSFPILARDDCRSLVGLFPDLRLTKTQKALPEYELYADTVNRAVVDIVLAQLNVSSCYRNTQHFLTLSATYKLTN